MLSQKVSKFIVIFIAFLLIFVQFWNRLIRERLPKELKSFSEYYPQYQVIVVILTIFILFCFITKLIRNILKKPLNQNGFIYKIILKISNIGIIKKCIYYFDIYIIKAPYVLYIEVQNRIPIADYIRDPSSYLVVYFWYQKFIYFMFLFLPRVFVAITFFIEVFCYNQLKYFYMISPLLLIPLLIKVYLYILNDISRELINFLNHHLDFREGPEHSHILHLTKKKVQPDIPGAWDLKDTQLDYLANLWNIYTNLNSFAETIYAEISKFDSYQQLITSLLYLFAWSYYLVIFLLPQFYFYGL